MKEKHVLEKLDLETAIYRILSNEGGPSQNELFEKLKEYVEQVEKSGLVLKVDRGNLSRKLRTLENDKIVFHNMKKMKDRDQDAYSYYITKDLNAFKYIMRHLAKNIDMALEFSFFNRKDMKIILEIKDDKPRDLTVDRKCAFIRALIKSSYVRQLIGIFGFKSVYQIYKKEVNDYCDLKVFIELAQSLVHEGSINDLDEFGPEFISDAESRKKAIEAINSALSKKQSNP